MHAAHPFRGPLFMTLSTCAYVINDAMMKLATEGLPPYEVLMLRGVWATLWGLPLLLALGYGRALGKMFQPRVVVRNLAELIGVLFYVVALANMPIADVIAIVQMNPLIVILGSALLMREPVGGVRLALIGCGFVGALLVAQPSRSGVSVYALLAFGTAVFAACRDLIGRGVPAAVPGLVVALSCSVIVLVGAGAAHLVSEDWVAPGGRNLALLAGSGLFLFIGHFFVFMAYRIGPTHRVAPFFYTFSVWAVIAGVVVFGDLPNALAMAGIALVIASGLVIVLLDTRGRRPAPVA
jgi:drug/metabolite transporter (DMT)-like permease